MSDLNWQFRRKKEYIQVKSRDLENDNNEVKIPCDYVVMAIGARPNKFDVDKLLENNIKVVKIGDCKGKASDIENAIKTAYDAANEI